MRPAAGPNDRRSAARLLVVSPETRDGAHALIDAGAVDLPGFLRAGDLVVLNDAATLPASLRGHGPQGQDIELRLLAKGPLSPRDAHESPAEEIWTAVLFGAGDWRTPTEHRAAPPQLTPGSRLSFCAEPAGSAPQRVAPLWAEVTRVADASPRLIEVRFETVGAAFLAALYAHGRPVQYAYLARDLSLWSVQTVYSARPWAVEMPSAGRPLSWEILLALRARGVELAWLTHAAGLSSSGDPALDRLLPLPERYEIPAATAAAIERTQLRGGRVLAVGTTCVRALEGAERSARAAGHAVGTLRPGAGISSLRLDGETRLAVVDGILTGLHGPGESHFDLLSAFADPSELRAAWQHASDAGYLCHEFGDLCLLWAQPDRRPRETRRPLLQRSRLERTEGLPDGHDAIFGLAAGADVGGAGGKLVLQRGDPLLR